MAQTAGNSWGGYYLITNDIIVRFKGHNNIVKNKKFYSSELKDYKIWCFNGEPKISLVCSERFSGKGLHEDFFDMEWNHISVKRPESPNAESAIQKPRNYTFMQELAKELSSGIPFVRIDFYEISGKVYFGEMTFFPASGFEKFEPESYDLDLGEMLFLS